MAYGQRYPTWPPARRCTVCSRRRFASTSAWPLPHHRVFPSPNTTPSRRAQAQSGDLDEPPAGDVGVQEEVLPAAVRTHQISVGAVQGRFARTRAPLSPPPTRTAYACPPPTQPACNWRATSGGQPQVTWQPSRPPKPQVGAGIAQSQGAFKLATPRSNPGADCRRPDGRPHDAAARMPMSAGTDRYQTTRGDRT